MQDRSALAEPVLSVAPRESQSSRGNDAQTLLLVESRSLVGGPSPLLAWLNPRERELVLSQGRRRVLNRGQTLFSQGAPHEGIYLVESGRIRVFYMAPSGREITLAYWHPGNFVGGPEIFGSGPHHVVRRRRHQQQRGPDSREDIARARHADSEPCRSA